MSDQMTHVPTKTPPFRTQQWDDHNRVDTGEYVLERVVFQSKGTDVVGNLFTPKGGGRHPAVALIGPVGFVKEQAPIQYASRLVKHDYVTLVFDPRNHGESGGEPRRYENGRLKTDDLKGALDLLAARPEVDPEQLYLLGICQGVNWAMQAAIEDSRVKALAMVAGNYLTEAFAQLYTGDEATLLHRRAQAKASREKWENGGAVDYIPVVSGTDPEALLTAKPVWEFYRRWEDRGPFWNFHGLWENRIAQMSGTETWNGNAEKVVRQLKLPTMMIHADRAANGPQEPKHLFEAIPAERKELVWLGDAVQMQFYEDPITIDRVVSHLARWLRH